MESLKRHRHQSLSKVMWLGKTGSMHLLFSGHYNHTKLRNIEKKSLKPVLKIAKRGSWPTQGKSHICKGNQNPRGSRVLTMKAKRFVLTNVTPLRIALPALSTLIPPLNNSGYH